MTVRFLHTSDWQIGKIFRFVGEQTMGVLQEARLAARTRLGELAREHNAAHVLVAGDVYDMEALSPRSLNQPLERMRTKNSQQRGRTALWIGTNRRPPAQTGPRSGG